MSKAKKTLKILNSKNYCLILYLISFLIIFTFLYLKNYSIAFLGIIIFWLGTCIYCFGNLEKRFFLLIFNLMIFVFVLDRPLINLIKGNNWYFSDLTLLKTFLSIYVSEIYLFLGNIIYEKSVKSPPKNTFYKNDKLLISVFILLLITFSFCMYVEVATYVKMHNFDYALIYTNVAPKFNIIVRTMNSLFPYVVFSYLALVPRKKESFIALALFAISGIPSFLLGSRNVLILRLLFCFSYIIIRYFLNKNEKWVTKKSIIAFVIMIPLVISFLGAYNYIRDNKKVNTYSIVDLSLDFFYKQGTTFDTIGQGMAYGKKLKEDFNVVSYTFGDLIDYATHNAVARKIFGTKDLGNGNSLNMIKYGNSMAHNLSYLVLGPYLYLTGHGRGTSYLIETYVDLNFIGVAIYSLVIGLFLSSIIGIMKNRGFMSKLITLTMLFQIFLLPRYSATGFVTFLITPQFWVVPISILIIDSISRKEKNIK